MREEVKAPSIAENDLEAALGVTLAYIQPRKEFDMDTSTIYGKSKKNRLWFIIILTISTLLLLLGIT